MSVFNNEWKKRNEYDYNDDYVKKLLNKFNIVKYNIVANSYGGSDIVIQHNLYKYKIEMDYINCCVHIRRGKMIFTSQKSSKEFMPIKTTIKEDLVWYDAIKWIVKDAKI